MKHQIILDIECFQNYFLVMFYNPVTDACAWAELRNEMSLSPRPILQVLESCELVTFNGNGYDLPVLSVALQGLTPYEIKRRVSDRLIDGAKPWQLEREVGFRTVTTDHIDLIEVAPGQASLKIYGGRLHCDKMQDLPYDPQKILTQEEMDETRRYCMNDVRTTAVLLKALTPQIELRREMSRTYGQDLRSKSDAQIAEAVITSRVSEQLGYQVKRQPRPAASFRYTAPEFIKYRLPQLQEALEIVTTQDFIIEKTGSVTMPQVLEDLKIVIGGSSYQMGIGGLHSTEKSVHHREDNQTIIADWDVASYYPSIILNCGLYPPQMGNVFLDIYSQIVQERLQAKASGDKIKADSLKITINGSFGKFGSIFSTLYSPNLLIQTTITGQLSLLMLIEWLESQGISVISGNTDGIVVKCHVNNDDLMQRIVHLWEQRTGFTMERSDYAAIFSRDVNNYIAVKAGNNVKTKGCFASAGLQKNPQNEICVDAVVAWLTKGIPVEETVRSCRDVRKFVTVRTVKGGAVKPLAWTEVDDWTGDSKEWVRTGWDALGLDWGPFKCKTKKRPAPVKICTDWLSVGKAIRWYYSTEDRTSTFNYRTSGNKVPRSDGAKALMNLPAEFPDDVDFDWYIGECYEMLLNVGMRNRTLHNFVGGFKRIEVRGGLKKCYTQF